MRSILVIVMVVLLIIAVVPSAQTAEPQPIEDHIWGGDPDGDPACEGWVQWWWYVMNVIYFCPLDVI